MIGAVNVSKNLGDGGKGLDRDFASDLKRREKLGQILVLSYLDAGQEGDFEDALGKLPFAARDDLRGAAFSSL